MSYPVPSIPQGSVMWDNDIEIVPASKLLELLQRIDTQHPSPQKCGFDVEASGLNPFDKEWDLTGFTFSFRTGKTTGKSYYVDLRFPNQFPTGFVLTYFKNWLRKNEHRLWAFNNSYEYKAMLRMTGESYNFKDARALSIAAHASGGLKALTQKYCSAHDWEVKNSSTVTLMGSLMSKVAKDDLTRMREIQARRRQKEQDGTLPASLDEFLTAEEIYWAKSILPWERVESYIKKKQELRGTGQEHPTETIIVKGEPREVEWHLSSNESIIETAIINGIRFHDILCGLMYDPSSGWGSAPTRILGPYCAWDGFYTVVLTDTLMTDPRLVNCYKEFEKEIRFAGVLESYGQCWDDRSTSEMNLRYLQIANDALADLVVVCELGEDDEWGQRTKLLQAMRKGIQYPFEMEWKYKTGGDYYGPVTVWVPDPISLQKDLESVEHQIQEKVLAGKKVPVALSKKRAAILEEIEIAPARRKEITDSFKTSDPNIGNWMVNILSQGKKTWIPVSTLAEYEAIQEYHRVKYIRKIERPIEINSKKVVVDSEESRLSILKDYFNPGSNTEDSKDRFWRPYMTPRVITANLFYGLMKYFEGAEQWEFVAGWMVDTEVQDVDKDGNLKFDEEGDPVFKKELQPRPISYVDPVTGQIEEIKEIFVDKNNLRDTIVNLNRLHGILATPVKWEFIDTSPDRMKALAAVNEFAVQYQEKRRAIHTEVAALRDTIRKGIDGLSSYITNQTGGFGSALIEIQHAVHRDFLGLKLTDRSTWSDEYKMVINLRLFKKCMKNRNTYLVGDKLGRGAVGRTPSPETDGVSEESLLAASIRRPIISNSYWRELSQNDDNYEHMHELSDNNQLFLATDFNPVSTETRRWRSRNHTVPAASELRRCYKPRQFGGIMDHSDFSGMELATVAAIAGEQSMIQAFINGDDIHMNTAMGVFGLPREEITPMMRRNAKISTFLILYGGELPALARGIGGSMSRAKELMEGFYRAYPKLRDYIFSYRQMAKDLGYVLTINGAPLNIDRNNLATVGTTSINYPIQGSATMVGGTSFYDMWAMAQELKLPFIPTSFTHDSLDSEQHPASYFLTKALMKFNAENEVLRKWNIPARLDGESGVSTYELVHTKIKSKFDAGSETNPHVIELKGPAADLEKLVAKFEPWYQIDREDKVVDHVKSEITELWVARRAFNSSMIAEEGYDIVKSTLKMARKSEIFVPDMSKPLYQQMQAAGL